jgi:hypothetical protein
MNKYRKAVKEGLGDAFTSIEPALGAIEGVLFEHEIRRHADPGSDTLNFTTELFVFNRDRKSEVKVVRVRHLFWNPRSLFKALPKMIESGVLAYENIWLSPLAALLIYQEAVKNSAVKITGGHAATLFAIYELNNRADSESICEKIRAYEPKPVPSVDTSLVEGWINDLCKMNCIELKDGYANLRDRIEIN